jgi:tetratricopeptide (TPR) repeat protein
MKRLATALFALLLVTSAHGDQRWTRATSPNFELYTTAPEKRAREAILRFEQVRSFFLKASGAKPSAQRRVRVVVFQSQKEYRPYQLGEGTAGHAGGDRDHDEIVMRGVTAEEYPIAVHEYVHILLKPIEHLPVWLNEGAAELYSTLTPVAKKVRVGDIPPGRYIELQQTKWLDLETLLQVTQDSPIYNGKEHRGIFYAESWALTHMLFLDAAYRDHFTAFMRRIAAGAAQPDAFREAFGKQPAEVEKDLHDYMRRRSYFAALFDVTLEKSAEDPEVRPATPLESGLALASIFDNTSRVDEARRAYEQLARENPSEPQIPEALAYLAWRSGKTGEARAHFAKAVGLGSRNSRLYYDYAGLIEDAGARREEQTRLLAKAVELDPEYRDARLQLAFLLLAQDDYRGALAHFARFKRVEPKEAFHFFYSVAYANFRLGNKEAARNAAQRAGEYAENPMNRTTIQELLAAMSDPPPAPAAPGTAQVAATPQENSPEFAHRPVLKRRGPSVTGTLVQVDCISPLARVRLRTGTGLVSLLMKDPGAIEIRGAGSVTFDCGPQRPRPVTIEYEPSTNDKLGTAGVVRSIEFR